MKTQKIIYWTATGLFSTLMLFSAYSYMTNDGIKAGFEHMGFPSFFRVELAAAKFIGALVLLIPALKGNVKEWAYAGFGITLISAFITHLALGDPASAVVMPVVIFAVLAASYLYYHKLQA